MTSTSILVALVVSQAGGHMEDASALPVCSNRVINAVVKRAGCTVGDARCWNRSRGFCMDWVERRLGAARLPDPSTAAPLRPEDVRPGDVAVFLARAHYAHVDRVVKDGRGRAVAVDLSEFNFGTCWVDEESMVTDTYGLRTRRAAIPLRDVDGGFLRPGPPRR